MPTLQSRTTLASGASATVDTDTYQNIVINVEQGELAVEAVMDSALTEGVTFKAWKGAVVVAAAAKLVCTGNAAQDTIFEVYAP